MSEKIDDIERRHQMSAIWQAIGTMGLEGRLPLSEARVLTESLLVWASYVRNGGNKTRTALELGRSRRVIRKIIRRLDGTGRDAQELPEPFRQWVLGAHDPVAVEGFLEPLALRSGAADEDGITRDDGAMSLAKSTAPRGKPVTTIDTHAIEITSGKVPTTVESGTEGTSKTRA